MTRDEMLEKLARALSERRMRHTLAVERAAAELAQWYGESEPQLRVAALLHDCAKEMPFEQMLSLAAFTDADEIERADASLLHAPVGAYVARAEYGVTDEKILRAIREHTTGAPEMDRFSTLLCLADYIEDTRSFPGVGEIRETARTDARRALILCLKRTVVYTFDRDLPVHTRTIDTYNSLLKRQIQTERK